MSTIIRTTSLKKHRDKFLSIPVNNTKQVEQRGAVNVAAENIKLIIIQPKFLSHVRTMLLLSKALTHRAVFATTTGMNVVLHCNRAQLGTIEQHAYRLLATPAESGNMPQMLKLLAPLVKLGNINQMLLHQSIRVKFV